MLTCSRPLIERRLRPQHDQALKCPRCDSTHTKFCYYNNYSLSQPRYFCKTCRRYWTKGGTLRNIPVGGGCRKNKKVSTKKSSDNHHIPTKPNPGSSSTSHSPTHLQLSFPEVQFSHLTNLLGNHGSGLISGHDHPSANFMDTKYNAFLENPRPIDFMESKYDQENSRILGHNFMGNNADQLGMISNGLGDHMDHTFHGSNTTFSTPYGMSLDGNYSGTFMDTCHRLMLPNYEGNEEQVGGIHEVKPNTKLLALEWQQDQGCADQIAGKDHPFGYLNTGLGSWTGLINGYGSSAANPLV